MQVLSGTDLIAEGKVKAVAALPKPEQEVTEDGSEEASREATEGPQWPLPSISTVEKDAFYRDLARMGLNYAPRFRMVEKVSVDSKLAFLR